MKTSLSVKATSPQNLLRLGKTSANSGSVTKSGPVIAPDLVLASRRRRKQQKIRFYLFTALVAILFLMGVLYFASP